MKRVTILLDPDGTRSFGTVLLVEAQTGATYEHEAAGHWCEHRRVEGICIPLGPDQLAARLVEFFRTEFRGWPPVAGGSASWSDAQWAACAERVREITVWDETPPSEGQWTPLELDAERQSEATEAWLPVRTPFGDGVLAFVNSD